MSEELKPCPFCGGSATAEQYDGVTGAQWCANCDDPDCVGGAMPLVRYAREIEAITAWNTRADSDRIEALTAENKRLREALATIRDRKWNTMTQGCDAACEAAHLARAAREGKQ